MSSESSDEDVHQCGRCKELFYDIQLYLTHKKIKTCRKIQGNAFKLTPLKKNISSAYHVSVNDDVNTQYASRNFVLRYDHSYDSSVKTDVPASEQTNDNNYNADFHSSTATMSHQEIPSATATHHVGVKRKLNLKNIKKAWAENYQDLLQERIHSDSCTPLDNEAQAKKRNVSATEDVKSVTYVFNASEKKDNDMTCDDSSVDAADEAVGDVTIHDDVAVDANCPSVDDDVTVHEDCPSLDDDDVTAHSDHLSVDDDDVTALPDRMSVDDDDATAHPDRMSVDDDVIQVIQPENDCSFETADPGTDDEADLDLCFKPTLKTYAGKGRASKSFSADSNKNSSIVVTKTPITIAVTSDDEMCDKEPQLFCDVRESKPADTSLRDTGGALLEHGSKRQLKARSRGFATLRKKSDLYPCQICSFRASYKHELERHLRLSHFLSGTSCLKCLHTCRDARQLREHVRMCRNATTSAQPTNDSPFVANKYRVRKHYVEKYSSVTFKVFVRFADSFDEVDDDTDGAGHCGVIHVTFRCRECQTVCSSYMSIIEHLSTHNNYFHSICFYCGRWFPSRFKLYRHIWSTTHDHLSERQALEARETIVKLSENTRDLKVFRNGKETCAACDAQFRSTAMFEKHVIKKHQPIDVVRKIALRCDCGSCPGDFATIKQVLAHVRKVHRPQPPSRLTTEFMCPVCAQTYTQNSLCHRHVENMHKPVQQVPFDVVAEEEESIVRLTASDDTALNTQITCSVCCHVVYSRTDYVKHMSLHHVWVPQPVHGPQPANLFSHCKNQHTNENYLCVNVDEWRTGTITGLPSRGLATNSAARPSDGDARQSDGAARPSGGAARRSSSADRQQRAVMVLQEFAAENQAGQESPGTEFGEQNTLKSVQADDASGADDGEEDSSGVGDIKEDSSGGGDAEEDPSACDVEEDPSVCDVEEDPSDSGDVAGGHEEARLPEQSATYTTPKIAVSNEKHSNGASERPSLVCPYCLNTTDSLKEMYDHKKNDHALMAVYQCIQSECRCTFDALGSYEAHFMVHDQKSFICNVCNYHTTSKSSLLMHKSSSHHLAPDSTASPFYCKLCQVVCQSREQLVAHARAEGHFMCNLCDVRVFKTRNMLQAHMSQHSDGAADFLCDLCGSKFANKHTLSRHRLLHTHARSHRCDVCGQQFNKREHLRRHIAARHSSERPFACDHVGCEATFKRKDKLKEHVTFKHLAKKPHKCDVCGKNYGYKEGLRHHMQTAHADGGKYRCTHCSVTFTRPSMLQQHVRDQHGVGRGGRNIYDCSECELSFPRPERLKRHQERMHAATVTWPAQCRQCEKGFAGQKSLDTHVAKHHGATGKQRKTAVDRFLEETKNRWNTPTSADDVSAAATERVVKLQPRKRRKLTELSKGLSKQSKAPQRRQKQAVVTQDRSKQMESPEERLKSADSAQKLSYALRPKAASPQSFEALLQQAIHEVQQTSTATSAHEAAMTSVTIDADPTVTIEYQPTLNQQSLPQPPQQLLPRLAPLPQQDLGTCLLPSDRSLVEETLQPVGDVSEQRNKPDAQLPTAGPVSNALCKQDVQHEQDVPSNDATTVVSHSGVPSVRAIEILVNQTGTQQPGFDPAGDYQTASHTSHVRQNTAAVVSEGFPNTHPTALAEHSPYVSDVITQPPKKQHKAKQFQQHFTRQNHVSQHLIDAPQHSPSHAMANVSTVASGNANEADDSRLTSVVGFDSQQVLYVQPMQPYDNHSVAQSYMSHAQSSDHHPAAQSSYMSPAQSNDSHPASQLSYMSPAQFHSLHLASQREYTQHRQLRQPATQLTYTNIQSVCPNYDQAVSQSTHAPPAQLNDHESAADARCAQLLLRLHTSQPQHMSQLSPAAGTMTEPRAPLNDLISHHFTAPRIAGISNPGDSSLSSRRSDQPAEQVTKRTGTFVPKGAKDLLAELLVQQMVPGTQTALKFGIPKISPREGHKEASMSLNEVCTADSNRTLTSDAATSRSEAATSRSPQASTVFSVHSRPRANVDTDVCLTETGQTYGSKLRLLLGDDRPQMTTPDNVSARNMRLMSSTNQNSSEEIMTSMLAAPTAGVSYQFSPSSSQSAVVLQHAEVVRDPQRHTASISESIAPQCIVPLRTDDVIGSSTPSINSAATYTADASLKQLLLNPAATASTLSGNVLLQNYAATATSLAGNFLLQNPLNSMTKAQEVASGVVGSTVSQPYIIILPVQPGNGSGVAVNANTCPAVPSTNQP